MLKKPGPKTKRKKGKPTRTTWNKEPKEATAKMFRRLARELMGLIPFPWRCSRCKKPFAWAEEDIRWYHLAHVEHRGMGGTSGERAERVNNVENIDLRCYTCHTFIDTGSVVKTNFLK